MLNSVCKSGLCKIYNSAKDLDLLLNVFDSNLTLRSFCTYVCLSLDYLWPLLESIRCDGVGMVDMLLRIVFKLIIW